MQNGEEEEKQSDANSDKGGAGVGIEALLAAVSSNGDLPLEWRQALAGLSAEERLKLLGLDPREYRVQKQPTGSEKRKDRRDQQQQQASSSSSSSSSAAAAAASSTQARRPSTLLSSLVKKSDIGKKTLPAEAACAAALKEGLRVSLKRKGPETRAPSPPAKEGRRETAVDVSDEEPNYDPPDDGQFSSSEPDETAPLHLTLVRQKPRPSPQEGEIPTLREPEVFSMGDVPQKSRDPTCLIPSNAEVAKALLMTAKANGPPQPINFEKWSVDDVETEWHSLVEQYRSEREKARKGKDIDHANFCADVMDAGNGLIRAIRQIRALFTSQKRLIKLMQFSSDDTASSSSSSSSTDNPRAEEAKKAKNAQTNAVVAAALKTTVAIMARELKRVSINLQTHEFSDVGNAINWNSLLFIVKLKQDAITMHRQLKDLTKEVDKLKDIVAGLKARSKDRGGYDCDGFAIPEPIRCYDCNTLGHLSPNCLNACKVCQQIKRLTGSTTLNVLHSPEDCPKKATDPDTWAALQAQVLKGSRGGGGGPYGGRRQGGGRGGKSRW